MEVRDETIDGLVLESRIDEKLGVPGAGAEGPETLIYRFQRAGRGGADGDDSPILPFGEVESFGRLLVHDVELRMHVMLADIVFLDGTECSQANMQCDVEDLDPLFQPPEKLFGEWNPAVGAAADPSTLA